MHTLILHGRVGVGDGGDGTTHGLQQQGDDVERDENVGVDLGAEAGVLSTVDCDDPRQSQIDSRGDESWRDGEGNQVPVINY